MPPFGARVSRGPHHAFTAALTRPFAHAIFAIPIVPAMRRCILLGVAPGLVGCALIHPRPTLVAGGDIAVPQKPRPVHYVGRNGERCWSIPIGPVELAKGGEVQCSAPGADTLTRRPAAEPPAADP